ncbi:uncharacterized protein LOC135096507 isoform X2 [Scylla paramamosain]|uniref:uncharacterized protein LOC135096507 isoform X2 n=1 Tax=Scylla paramamosain TaxID=85552 RepID=UPI0030835AE7
MHRSSKTTMRRHILVRATWNLSSKMFKHCLCSRDFILLIFAVCLLYICMQLLETTRDIKSSLRIATASDNRYLSQLSTIRESSLFTAMVAADAGEKEQLARIVRRIPNVPLSYTLGNKPVKNAKDKKCSKYPTLYDIQFNNIYWQVLHTTNGTFYLYSAFFDNRPASPEKPSVRILAMADRVTPAVTIRCQLWYEGEEDPVVTKVSEYKYIWVKSYGNYKNGILQPYLLQCIVPMDFTERVPLSVSLVEDRCDPPKNNLRVINNLPGEGGKENFAVCVKGMSGTRDNSLKMVEWLELMFLLGAHKVFLYDMGVHSNMSKIFRYYESQGKVDLKSLTLPGDQPNDRDLLDIYLKHKVVNKRQNEVIPYNDCLYRNMNRYKFIVLLDTDEIIMPRTTQNWETLMKKIAPEVMSGSGHPRSSYVARHVYFLDSMQEEHGWATDVPHYMHFLQHVYRAFNYTGPGSYVKCFHDPQRVHTLHNHYPISCLKGGCSHEDMPTELVHLQHYRSGCKPELKKVCPLFLNHTVLEDSILRYKEPLVRGTVRTLRDLGFTLD